MTSWKLKKGGNLWPRLSECLRYFLIIKSPWKRRGLPRRHSLARICKLLIQPDEYYWAFWNRISLAASCRRIQDWFNRLTRKSRHVSQHHKRNINEYSCWENVVLFLWKYYTTIKRGAAGTFQRKETTRLEDSSKLTATNCFCLWLETSIITKYPSVIN